MPTVLFYGNCQAYAVKEVLNLGDEWTQYHVQCFSTDISQKDFDDILQKCDVIITQPIHDNYRDIEHLSTTYIVNKCNSAICTILIFDSCHFDFYYFDMTYKEHNGAAIDKPVAYHYNKMMEYYLNKSPEDDYVNEIVNNIHLKTKEELELLANNSILELRRRSKQTIERYKSNYNVRYAFSNHFILHNYKDKLLFYSMNHPTKWLLHHICEQIVVSLKILNRINYDVDPLQFPTKGILYKCLQQVVHFDIEIYQPHLAGKTTVKSITKKYYEAYKELAL